jgi:hypothetical protein
VAVLKLFSEDRDEAISKYREYMAEADRLDWKKEAVGMYGDYIMGSDDFVKKIRQKYEIKSLPEKIYKKEFVRCQVKT